MWLRRNSDGAREICVTSAAGAGLDGRESAVDIAIGTVQHNGESVHLQVAHRFGAGAQRQTHRGRCAWITRRCARASQLTRSREARAPYRGPSRVRGSGAQVLCRRSMKAPQRTVRQAREGLSARAGTFLVWHKSRFPKRVEIGKPVAVLH